MVVDEQIDRILNWQVNLIVKETLFQGVSENHKIHITDEMMNEAKDLAKQDIKKLLLEARKDEIGEVYGLMENDISLWTDAAGQPLRLSERIDQLSKEADSL